MLLLLMTSNSFHVQVIFHVSFRVPVKSEPRDPAPQPVVPVSQESYQVSEPSYTQPSQALATEDDQTLAYQEDNYEEYQYEDQAMVDNAGKQER